ncbi:integrase family protein [Desulfatibacillum aliphaticivorans]|uniref:Integrase family protein n=1 Tax=Desulfatibacillum aliphaticivorans TaxID=218208 RepID=B8F8V6_DESAL|nr:site-specific integrase [Desulfatibacillum aliphaticivorans]ACL01988.1 integrase family protein [Desulfatibacillum aliphaticivorans]
MAIFMECPNCRKKQSLLNQKCTTCLTNLASARKSNRVRYWIHYRLPNKKNRWELSGYSYDRARAAEGKRLAQKSEGTILDPRDAKTTFDQVTEWYLDLESVQALRSLQRVEDCLKRFNQVFGLTPVNSILNVNLEQYQGDRLKAGASPATVDMELRIAHTMINKAFDNDIITEASKVLKAFRRTKKLLKSGQNARDRLLSMEEYIKLHEAAGSHLKEIIAIAFFTGMRRGEILGLKWPHIDFNMKMIRLSAEETKEAKPKSIPLSEKAMEILEQKKRPKKEKHVFLYRGKPITTRVRTALWNACDKAGISYGRKQENGFVFHDLRSTVKTNMLRAGVDKVMRDIILGHALKGMDRYYLKPNDKDLHDAMKIYTDWLDLELEKARMKLEKKG